MSHLTCCTYALFVSTKNNLRRKIILTKLFSEKNDFLENIFRRLVRTKKLQNAKIRVWQMSPESDNVQSPSPDSDEKLWPDPAGSGHIWPDPGRFGQIQIGHIRHDPGHFWPDPARAALILTTRCCQTLPLVGFWLSTIANFW
jgi:hypothetical protein